MSIKIFISYAHKDKNYKEALREQFAPWIKNNEITLWADNEIKPGQFWDEEILNHLKDADVIIMLLSAAFFDSEYIQSTEFNIALGRHKTGQALAIGVVLSACSWEQTEIKSFQLLPEGAIPIDLSPTRARRATIFKKVAKAIMTSANGFERKTSSPTSSVSGETDGGDFKVFIVGQGDQQVVDVDLDYHRKAMPHFTAHLYKFIEHTKKSIDEHRKAYVLKHESSPHGNADILKLKVFLQMLCREVNEVLFTWGGVRTHFRCLHIDKEKYVGFAVAFSDRYDDTYRLTAMPSGGDKISMISKAAERGAPLIYSLNKNQGWHSGPDPAERDDFKDYVTFVLMDNAFIYQGKYLLSMGISFQNPELQKNLLYILTISRFDDIVANIVKSFAEAINISIVDTIIKNKHLLE